MDAGFQPGMQNEKRPQECLPGALRSDLPFLVRARVPASPPRSARASLSGLGWVSRCAFWCLWRCKARRSRDPETAHLSSDRGATAPSSRPRLTSRRRSRRRSGAYARLVPVAPVALVQRADVVPRILAIHDASASTRPTGVPDTSADDDAFQAYAASLRRSRSPRAHRDAYFNIPMPRRACPMPRHAFYAIYGDRSLSQERYQALTLGARATPRVHYTQAGGVWHTNCLRIPTHPFATSFVLLRVCPLRWLPSKFSTSGTRLSRPSSAVFPAFYVL